MRRPDLDPRAIALAAILLLQTRTAGADVAEAQARPWSSTGVAQWPLRLTVGNARHEATVNAVAKDRYLIVLEE